MSLSSRIPKNDETSSSTAKPICVGKLHRIDPKTDLVTGSRNLYVGHDLIIGRDSNKCQWSFDDLHISAKHLRLYTIVYDDEEKNQTEYLTYAEDSSRNGTFWNGALIGKGKGGFLLSHNDKLCLSSKVHIRFSATDTQFSRQHFDLEQEMEMRHFRNEYVLTDRLLGAGAFGQVFMAVEQRSRTQLACKVINLRSLIGSKSPHFATGKLPVEVGKASQRNLVQKTKTVSQKSVEKSRLEEHLRLCYREVEILATLRHPNIIGLDKVFVTDNTMYMFTELMAAGDLFSYLESKDGQLIEAEAAVLLRQLLIALKYLHDQDIVHRDLKPENILLTSLSTGCRIVLTDFGAARRLSPQRRMFSVVGSDQYAAPEIKSLTSGSNAALGYTKAVDMWSVGAIAVVLMTGASAFADPITGVYSPTMARACKLDALVNSRGWRQIRPRPRDFISCLLVAEDSRMTAEQALRHDWFSNEMHETDFEALYQRTVKSWHPRVTQKPVVEFCGSTYIRDLDVSQSISGNVWCRRPEQPVNSQYKPFARNMHALLWPQRKMGSSAVSGEVRKAIAEKWPGTSQTLSPRPGAKKSSNPIASPNSRKRKLQQPARFVDDQTNSEMLPKHNRAISLPLRSTRPPPPLFSKPDVVLTGRGNSASEETTKMDSNLADKRDKCFLRTKEQLVQAQPVPSATQSGVHASSKLQSPRYLSRKTRTSFSSNKGKKRKRDSTFDIDDLDEESSDSADGAVQDSPAGKRNRSAQHFNPMADEKIAAERRDRSAQRFNDMLDEEIARQFSGTESE